MKTIDFSINGGFPLTQDELDYLQLAYTEGLNALSATGEEAGQPAILRGMDVTTGGGGSVTVTDGWLLYNGDLIAFTGSTVTLAGSGVALVTINTNTTYLTYNDGGVHPSLRVQVATLTVGTATTTATVFPLSALRPFHHYFGLRGRETGWTRIVVNTIASLGSVAGDIYYKKNLINNTLHLRAVLTANNALNFNASPNALNYLMGTLPSGYIPATNAYFTAYYHGSNLFKDDLGIAWVKHLSAAVNTSGQISVNFIKPESAITAYSIVFNHIIPLD